MYLSDFDILLSNINLFFQKNTKMQAIVVDAAQLRKFKISFVSIYLDFLYREPRYHQQHVGIEKHRS